MKLLFDQNISFKILKKIESFFTDAQQVRTIGLENASDIDIFNFARDNNYAIVTFDADFRDLNTLLGTPPKIIWLRIGNTNTKNLSEFIEVKKNVIHDFLNSERFKDMGCLELIRLK